MLSFSRSLLMISLVFTRSWSSIWTGGVTVYVEYGRTKAKINVVISSSSADILLAL
jgi:hypothetical protein